MECCEEMKEHLKYGGIVPSEDGRSFNIAAEDPGSYMLSDCKFCPFCGAPFALSGSIL